MAILHARIFHILYYPLALSTAWGSFLSSNKTEREKFSLEQGLDAGFKYAKLKSQLEIPLQTIIKLLLIAYRKVSPSINGHFP